MNMWSLFHLVCSWFNVDAPNDDSSVVSELGSSKRSASCIESLLDMVVVRHSVPLKCLWRGKGVCQQRFKYVGEKTSAWGET